MSTENADAGGREGVGERGREGGRERGREGGRERGREGALNADAVTVSSSSNEEGVRTASSSSPQEGVTWAKSLDSVDTKSSSQASSSPHCSPHASSPSPQAINQLPPQAPVETTMPATLRRVTGGGAAILVGAVLAAGLAGGWGLGVDLRAVLPSFENGELPNTLLYLKADMLEVGTLSPPQVIERLRVISNGIDDDGNSNDFQV